MSNYIRNTTPTLWWTSLMERQEGVRPHGPMTHVPVHHMLDQPGNDSYVFKLTSFFQVKVADEEGGGAAVTCSTIVKVTR